MTDVPTTTTFTSYYRSLDNDGTSTNCAVPCLNEAMDTTMTSSSKFVNLWSDPHGVILLKTVDGVITIVHGVKNMGGTFNTLGVKIVGHIGLSLRAMAGVVNHLRTYHHWRRSWPTTTR